MRQGVFIALASSPVLFCVHFSKGERSVVLLFRACTSAVAPGATRREYLESLVVLY